MFKCRTDLLDTSKNLKVKCDKLEREIASLE